MNDLSAADGSCGLQNLLPEDEFKQRLDQLAEQWQSHRGQDLEVRYKTGELLNQRFGDPDDGRQARGQGVLKGAAERLQVAVSELSRMRRFAHACTSPEDLRRRYPEATTWSAVKDLLPKLSPRVQPGGQAPSGSVPVTTSPRKPRAPKFGGLKKALVDLSSKLRKGRPALTDTEKADLRKELKDLARAIGDCPNIRVTVGQVSADEVLPAVLQEAA